MHKPLLCYNIPKIPNINNFWVLVQHKALYPTSGVRDIIPSLIHYQKEWALLLLCHLQSPVSLTYHE